MWDHIRGAIVFVFFLKSEEGTPRSLFHEVGANEQYGYWRWPVSSCIRHAYYQISTTVQIFPVQSKTLANNWLNYISSFLKLYGGDGKVQPSKYMLTQNMYVPARWMYISIRPACFRGVTSTLFTALHEWRKSTVAQWLKWKKKKKRKRGQTSALPHMAPLDVGTVFTVTFLEDKVELNNMSSLSHISPNIRCTT